MDLALSNGQTLAQPPSPDLWPPVSSEEELSDCLDYYYLRDFPACGAGHSKGRTRRERELRTNRPVPGGHERKIAQKLVNGQRKRRQRKLQPRPRTRLACALDTEGPDKKKSFL
ncbi:nuclear protein 2 [Molossus nigricans]|uniref:Nuclear protein 2, transcriptional regulator n=1 Tax=Molossus molossus TaxID=27622 RepID=A0A7J8J296_MOLMO|nr:nuclear protein 2 [Molossus molossus]KAF6490465.1 nuclear protein 2, transcriptional regulator [Molossus molossus]